MGWAELYALKAQEIHKTIFRRRAQEMAKPTDIAKSPVILKRPSARGAPKGRPVAKQTKSTTTAEVLKRPSAWTVRATSRRVKRLKVTEPADSLTEDVAAAA